MGADFGSTHWSLILDAVQGDSPEARAAIDALCRAYWYPLYVFARGQCEEDAATDATQDFFERQVLTGAVFKGAERQRGKFRAWLVASMKNHLKNDYDFRTAAKRGGGERPVALEDFAKAEGRYRQTDHHGTEAGRNVDRAWAMTVLRRSRELLAQRYRESKRDELYQVLQNFLPGDEGSLSSAAKELGKTQGATKTAVSRFRDDFGDAVRFEIGRTVSSPAEVDEEIRALIVAVGA